MRNLFHDPIAERIEYLDNRYYTKEKDKYEPSSTTILDVFPKGEWYVKWLKEQGDNADKIRDEAGERGSNVHAATEAIDKGLEVKWADENGKPLYKLEEWQMILNYVDFKEKVNPTILAIETVLCSHKLGFGGTLDRVVEFGGKRWVLDIKTSNQMSATYVLQLASYAMLWNEENPNCKVTDICILWLKANIKTDKIDEKKETWQGRPYANTKGWQIVTFDENYKDAYKDFEHVKAIWKRANKNYKPLNLIYPDRIKIEPSKTNELFTNP